MFGVIDGAFDTLQVIGNPDGLVVETDHVIGDGEDLVFCILGDREIFLQRFQLPGRLFQFLDVVGVAFRVGYREPRQRGVRKHCSQ